MTKQQQEAAFDNIIAEMRKVMIEKGDDYANEDRLSNFKLSGGICGISPELNCLSLIATKVARLGVLLQGKEPKNESIKDSVLDLSNYSLLLNMIIIDKES